MAAIKNRDWVEPAHPVLVQKFGDLVEIYRYLKDAIQPKVDTIFDRVSQQIGFVVTTTLPVRFHIIEGGMIERVEFSAKNLQGTLFEKDFAPLFKELAGKKLGKVAAGNYSLYLIWYEALKLKLKTDWIEPAHFRTTPRIPVQVSIADELANKLNPGIREPAHWFDAGIALDNEEELLIAAIDEVYVDLKLANRVAVSRREGLQFVPGIREPAHFRQIEDLLEREDAGRLIGELSAVLKKYGM
ncbi:MAG: hypothetical protein M0023_03585 [Desulfobacteraceae bacterium]|nr:hypothetical protein [Desulfobacteraceae bacterium]